VYFISKFGSGSIYNAKLMQLIAMFRKNRMTRLCILENLKRWGLYAQAGCGLVQHVFDTLAVVGTRLAGGAVLVRW